MFLKNYKYTYWNLHVQVEHYQKNSQNYEPKIEIPGLVDYKSGWFILSDDRWALTMTWAATWGCWPGRGWWCSWAWWPAPTLWRSCPSCSGRSASPAHSSGGCPRPRYEGQINNIKNIITRLVSPPCPMLKYSFAFLFHMENYSFWVFGFGA